MVCPAGLTTKWRDEMAEKFGRDFIVIDSERCALVRREYGRAANPFEVYPLSIVSLPWLRMPKAQRLLAEVLPAGAPSLPRTFDLLILDEAHHVAPAAPQQVYAVDSQQTKLIRRLAPHFTHRLFLSATPHNGYPASFTALLEILDDQRFARGVTPDPAAVRDTVVRRLKRDIARRPVRPHRLRPQEEGPPAAGRLSPVRARLLGRASRRLPLRAVRAPRRAVCQRGAATDADGRPGRQPGRQRQDPVRELRREPP